MKILILVLMLSPFLKAEKDRASTSDMVRAGYSDSLRIVLTNIEKITHPKTIAYCIPTTSAEATIYFSFDYDKALSAAFHKLQHKLLEYTINGDTELLTLYLYLSQFVDGYFAEDYFIAIEKIANSKKANFCTALKNSAPEKVERLGEAKSNHCK